MNQLIKWFVNNLPYLVRWLLYISIAFLTPLISSYDQVMNDIGNCSIDTIESAKFLLSDHSFKCQVLNYGLCEIKIIGKVFFESGLQALIAWRAFIDQSGTAQTNPLNGNVTVASGGQ